MSDYEHELATRAHEAKLQAFYIAEEVERERLRPFMLLRPRLWKNGGRWMAIYGEDKETGYCGVHAFGETPAKAATQFDIEWLNARGEK